MSTGCKDVTEAVRSKDVGTVAPSLLDLRYAGETARADRNIVMRAVSKQGYMLKYASSDLQGDKEVVSRALSQDGRVLAYASKEMCADREVVMKAVPQFGLSLQHVSNELRNDKEVVMAAVAESGSALEYASPSLRGDEDVVMAAVGHTASALQYALEPVVSHSSTLHSLAAILAPRYFVLKVTLLSGRSCVLTSERWHKDSAKRIAEKCVPLLDLGARMAAHGAHCELLIGTEVIPEGDPVEAWHGVESGKVNELMLILPSIPVDASSEPKAE